MRTIKGIIDIERFSMPVIFEVDETKPFAEQADQMEKWAIKIVQDALASHNSPLSFSLRLGKSEKFG